MWMRLVLLISFAAGAAPAATPEAPPHWDKQLDTVPELSLPALDQDKLAREDVVKDASSHLPMRFAVGHDFALDVDDAGDWQLEADGSWSWRLRIDAADAVHLNFGFDRFALPDGAELWILALEEKATLGPYRAQDRLAHGQLWTPVLPGARALLLLSGVSKAGRDQVQLRLSRIGQGYRGFGQRSKWCKSGACNMDVACLGSSDPWNEPRRAVGAYTRGGTDTCTGSLVNNTANDRRMLFATASHCSINSDAVAASVVVYWNYESPTCRTPGSSESGQPLPKPSSTTQGLRFLAATPSISGSAGTTATRSDWTLIELATPAANNTFNLFWAGWDRSPPPSTCAAPADPASTDGLCAGIHHPAVDEKRITFVQTALTQGNYSSSSIGLHWDARWDPTPPLLPNVQPAPSSLPPGVTEPGSSGSPLYNAQRRLVGVLSGGPSACGATGESLRDYYGGLFHAWEGEGTATTRVRDYLDPIGSGVTAIDGVNSCTAPAVPAAPSVSSNGDNRLELSWPAVAGADRYRVYRALGSCPGGSYSQIAETSSPSYSDADVSGGSSYSYQISALTPGGCESSRSACSAASASGSCRLAPSFAGLGSATNAGSASCSIALQWPSASGQCGSNSNLRYNVYRAGSSGFTPGASNLLASCLTSTTNYSDASAAPGQTYHYLVRAEDLAAGGGSGRCGGREDGNLVSRSAAAFGPTQTVFNDDVEAATPAFSDSGTGATGSAFVIVSSVSRSPSRSWFVPDLSTVVDRRLTLNSGIALPAGSAPELEFYHRYSTESRYDGGVLEYSLDGVVWSDILAGQGSIGANAARFIEGGYDNTISPGSALASRRAYSGSLANFSRVRVNLADFAGRTLQLRFRFASDSSVAGAGWWIDDIRIAQGSACSAAPGERLFRDGFEATAAAQ